MQCSRDHDNLTNNNLNLFKYIQSLYLASTGIQPCFTCFLLFKNTRVTPWFCLHHQQGDMIASCDSRGVLKLWDIRQSVPIMSVDAGPRPANQAAFDYSGRNFYQLFFLCKTYFTLKSAVLEPDSMCDTTQMCSFERQDAQQYQLAVDARVFWTGSAVWSNVLFIEKAKCAIKRSAIAKLLHKTQIITENLARFPLFQSHVFSSTVCSFYLLILQLHFITTLLSPLIIASELDCVDRSAYCAQSIEITSYFSSSTLYYCVSSTLNEGAFSFKEGLL